MNARLKLVLSMYAIGVVAVSVVGIGTVLADTGPGGGCHPDIYVDTNDQRAPGEPRIKFYCKNIDCPFDCVQTSVSYGSHQGQPVSTCPLCPGMSGQCAAGVITVTEGVQLICLWQECPGGLECVGGSYPPGEPFAGQGYEEKLTCWCD
jgi:hypothetical protein